MNTAHHTAHFNRYESFYCSILRSSPDKCQCHSCVHKLDSRSTTKTNELIFLFSFLLSFSVRIGVQFFVRAKRWPENSFSDKLYSEMYLSDETNGNTLNGLLSIEASIQRNGNCVGCERI